MRWSKLKQRIESGFASAVRGRVEVWNTRYRESHDQEGEAWFTIDGERVWRMPTLTYMVTQFREYKRIYAERGCTSWKADGEAYRDATRRVHDDGIFAMWDVNKALFRFLNLSIDDALRSTDPIVRALAVVDSRFGKRRLRSFDDSQEHPFVQGLFRFRCTAEHIKPVSAFDVESSAGMTDSMADHPQRITGGE